ncbi:MAG: hypothetical protein EBU85_02910 [Actinobacteria bacterium]|nr:hypothetical protein [Actinomycetota bacterium]
MKRVGASLVALLALVVAGCADKAATLTLQQAIQGQSRAALGKEKPVLAVCGALRVIAQNPRAVGLDDLRAGASTLKMGVQGAAAWVNLAAEVQNRAGANWMKTSRASAMLFRDWLLFSQPILQNFDRESATSSPDVAAITKNLRGLQGACTAIYGSADYNVVQ